MKKFLLFTLLVLHALLSNAVVVELNGISYNLNTTSITSGSYYASVVGCNISGSIVIPDEVVYHKTEATDDGYKVTEITYPVTGISSSAFDNCKDNLTSITIGKNVTSYSSAISRCTNLSSITFNCISVGGCSNLKSLRQVHFSGNVKEITSSAFSGCSGLTSVTIGNSVTSIGKYAFEYCSGLTSVTIGNSVTSIDYRTFYDCSSLTSVTIGNSVTSIGESAFSGCSGLTSVTIGNSVTSIGKYAFEYCSGLTSVTIGNSVTNIDYRTFYGCSGLTSVTIPGSVTSIGSSAFSGCSGLTSIIIPNSVTSIGSYAFSGCSGLTSIIIPNSVTSIGSSAFSGCSGLTSIIIPNSVTSIGEYAFSSCTSLTSVTIPNSVTSIGNNAFYGCRLSSVYITDLSAWYSNISFDEYWYINTQQAFNLYLNNEKVTHLLIPKEAKVINTLAFRNCQSIETIAVEAGNTVYDSRQNCNAIIETASNTLIRGCKSTIIPEDVVAIANDAFRGVYDLTSITIPGSIQRIGQQAFIVCKLRNVLIKCATTPAAVTNSFSEQTYTHTTLYIPTGSWDAYAYDDAWYRFINIRETAMTEEEVSTQQAYTLMDAGMFTYSVYDPVNDRIGTVSSVSGIDENNPNHNWQVIEADGSKYLYNVGAKKFVSISAGGSFTLSSTPTSVTMEDGKDGLIFGGQADRQWALVSNERMSAEQAIIDGISLISDTSTKRGDTYYDLNGRKQAAPQKGVNIVRSSDGMTRKMLVK